MGGLPQRNTEAEASQLFQRALQSHQRGALDEAERLYRAALALQRDHLPALANRGVALRDLGRPSEALASYEAALAIRPDHVWSLNNRGVALMDLGRTGEALASFVQALALKPDYAEAHNNRGKALASRETATTPDPDPAEALASYERAITLRPDFAEAHDNRGVLLAELGRSEEAIDAIERAISLSPRTIRFYYHLAQARRLAPGDPHIAAMEALAQNMAALSEDDQTLLNFALAKALADVGDHAKSFQRLADGNALRRRRIVYDEAASLGELERIGAAFTGELMARNSGLGEPSATPVFIVGMPRSGTTLVEQILAGHPGVFAAGETDAVGQAVAALGLAADAAFGTGSDSPPFRQVGERYLDRVRAIAPAAQRITNKRTDNFRFAGLIHLALPNARIIHMRREPIDTCLSCFSKLFGEELPYTFDLGELGRYHLAYDRLMAHWRAVLPAGVMLEVQYEELVADLEGQTRRIFTHCGLDWDPRRLDFHKTERRVRTASAVQVRQPIYGGSVGRWRAYEPLLAPLLDVLGRSGRN